MILYILPLRTGSTVTRGTSSSSLSSSFSFLLLLLLLLPTTFCVFSMGFSCCCWSAAACTFGTVDGEGVDDNENDTAAADAALVLILCCWPFRSSLWQLAGVVSNANLVVLFSSSPATFRLLLVPVYQRSLTLTLVFSRSLPPSF